MASSGFSTAAMSRPPSFLKNFSSAGVAPTRITGFPALRARATSDTVPAPISPQTTTTLLDMTFTLFRALPISVMIARSTYLDTRSRLEGKTPIVKLPGTFLAPWQAASITPTSRPPVSTTHSRRAINSPSTRALSTSFFLAFAGPITPTMYRIPYP